MCGEQFYNKEQQDAAEFMNEMLNSFEEMKTFYKQWFLKY